MSPCIRPSVMLCCCPHRAVGTELHSINTMPSSDWFGLVLSWLLRGAGVERVADSQLRHYLTAQCCTARSAVQLHHLLSRNAIQGRKDNHHQTFHVPPRSLDCTALSPPTPQLLSAPCGCCSCRRGSSLLLGNLLTEPLTAHYTVHFSGCSKYGMVKIVLIISYLKCLNKV